MTLALTTFLKRLMLIRQLLIQQLAILSIFRVMQRPEFMHAHFWKVAFQRSKWTTFAVK